MMRETCGKGGEMYRQICLRLEEKTGLFVCFFLKSLRRSRGFPSGSDSKESACNARDLSSIPESGRSPGEKNGNPLQYSCLENPRDRGVHGVAKSQTQLTDHRTAHPSS